MGDRTVVKLVVYDLSMGMARQMGPMLGLNLEYLPHTGVIVFGQEYFFGGGIQRMRHEDVIAQFGLRPFRQDTLGTTTRTPDELHEFLRTVDSRFQQSTYDLFHNNCNHFSDAVVRFLLNGTGIASEIVELPQRILSTPLGQSLAPMFNSMQQRMQQELVPFNRAGGVTSLPAVVPPPSQSRAPVPKLSLREALEKLRTETTDDEYLVAMETLLRIVRNIITNPMEPKYRRLPRANEKLQNTIGRFPHGLACLYSLCFEPDASNQFLAIEPDATKWDKLVLGEKMLAAARKGALKSIIERSGAKTAESALQAVGEDRKDDVTVKELLSAMFASS